MWFTTHNLTPKNPVPVRSRAMREWIRAYQENMHIELIKDIFNNPDKYFKQTPKLK